LDCSLSSQNYYYFLNIIWLEVSLAHLAREVDVQPSHPDSSPHRREFGILFFFKKTKIAVGASPTAFPFKKKILFGLYMSS
jgi:hypothetical protein